MSAATPRWCTLLVVGLCGGCNDGVLKGVEFETPPPSRECRDGAPDSGLDFRSCQALSPVAGVDLLLVLDDGPNAASLQSRVADFLPALVAKIEERAPDIELRIGFTSAHDGNPACPSRPGTGGALRLDSCREHPEDFIGRGGSNRFDELCAARCDLPQIEVLPTATRGDSIAAERRWIEVGPDTNLPTGADQAEALACAAMLGTQGCVLTAPLASAWRSVRRSEEPLHDSAGFWRWDAVPVVVVVSGGHECSVTRAGTSAFDPSGDRVLWSDPQLSSATPAACWNAGVTCGSGMPARQRCGPRDLGVDGEPVTPDDAVLHPIEAFVERFDALAQQRQLLRKKASVIVALLTGVPEGFTLGDSLVVRDAADPQTATEFGVAPICELDGDPLVPPVRPLAFARAAQQTHGRVQTLVESACGDDDEPMLERLVDAIGDQIRPLCMPACVADADEDRDGLQVECEVVFRSSEWSSDAIELPECDIVDGTVAVPTDAGCWEPAVGDSLHPVCAAEDWNLELRLHWDGPIPTGLGLFPSCKISRDRARDCPGL